MEFKKKLTFLFFAIFLSLVFINIVSATSTTGLISEYKMNDNAASVTVIDSISGLNGTAGVNTNTLSIPGRINRALKLDGVSNYLSYNSNISNFQMGMNSFTVAGWVNLTGSFSNNPNIFGVSASATTSRYALEIASDGTFGTHIKDDSGNIVETRTSNSVPLHHWDYAVMVVNRDTDLLYLYFNGVLDPNYPVNISSVTGNINPQGEALSGAQSFGGTAFLNGSLDDVRLYNRALSQSEVSQLYNSGSGTESDVFLSLISPANSQFNYLSNPVSFNFNTTVGTYIVNYSLYDNSTGTWKRNQTFNDFGFNATYHNASAPTTSSGGFVNVINFSNINNYISNVTYQMSGNPTFAFAVGRVNITYTNGSVFSQGNTTSSTSGTETFTVYNPLPHTNVSNITMELHSSSGGRTVTMNLVDAYPIFNNTGIFNMSNNYPTTQSPFIWNFEVCSSTGCSFASSNYTFNPTIFENSNSFDSNVYETQSETYSLNISTADNLTSGFLIFNGTIYPTNFNHPSTNNYIFNLTKDIPTTIGTFPFYYTLVDSLGTTINSSVNNQTISPINFTICDGPPLNVPFLNISFLDESNSTHINGSLDAATFNYYLGSGSIYKTLSYQNSSRLYNYTFCANPSNMSLNVNETNLQYSSAGYPQRVANNNYVLTSSTTQQTLYLLAAANGIYTSIQTVQSIGANLPGVYVTAERQLNDGTWILIGAQTSDSAGIVTFWVNPNFPLRLTGTLTGYVTNQVTINPSQTQYTLTMVPLSGNTTFTSSTAGMSWTIFPSSGQVNSTGVTIFGMNLTAANNNLLSCKLNLVRSNDSVVIGTVTATGNSSSCNLQLPFTLPTEVRVFGQFYVWTSSSGGFFLIDADSIWYSFETSNFSPWDNVVSLFHDLNNYPEFGSSELRQQFSKIIFFYFFLVLGLGILTFFTEYDRMYPGFFIILIFVAIAVASGGGFLTLNYGTAGTTLPLVMQQYTILLICGLYTAGYVLNRFAADT